MERPRPPAVLPPSTPRPVGRVRRAVVRPAVVAVLALGVLVVAAGPAWAHASLVESDPGAGAVLIEAPRVVDLRFSEPVVVAADGVRLFDGSGDRVATGTPTNPEDRRVRVPVRAALADGVYVVTWRVTSADTHPVRGAFTFTVGRATGPGADDPSILAQELLEGQGGDPVVGAAWAVARWLVFVGIALFVGGLAFVVGLWSAGLGQARARWIVTVGWWVLAVATLAGFVLRGPYVTATGPDRLVDVGLWGDVAGSRFGIVWLGRLVLLAGVGLLARRAFAVGPAAAPSRGRTVATALGLTAICATPALAGHPASGDLVVLTTVLDVVHVAAMALWVGGLVVMGVVVVRGDDPDGRRVVVRRFGRVAFWSIVVLTVTGLFAAWRDVRSFANLRETDFGNILVVKTAIVVMMVVVAAFSREIVARLFLRPPAAAADDAAADPVDPALQRAVEWRSLRRSVWAEALIGLAVLGASAALVNAAPAVDAAAVARPGVTGVTLRNPLVTVDVSVTPGRSGVNDVHVNTYAPKGTPLAVRELSLTLDLPSRGVAPVDVPLRRVGPGHYLSPGFTVPFPGAWRITAEVLVTDVDLVTLEGRIPIG